MKAFRLTLALLLGVTAAFAKAPSAAAGPAITDAGIRAVAPFARCGAKLYLVVNREWVEWWWNHEYMPTLGRLGVGRYEARVNCTFFAGAFVELAKASFMRAEWHKQREAKALAIGAYWYAKSGQMDPNGAGHAVVSIYTQRGLEYFEPQTGQWVKLSHAETLIPILNYY